MMKEHISITIDDRAVRLLKRFAAEEHRSVSQVVELAVLEFLTARSASSNSIVASDGEFARHFSREDTYADR